MGLTRKPMMTVCLNFTNKEIERKLFNQEYSFMVYMMVCVMSFIFTAAVFFIYELHDDSNVKMHLCVNYTLIILSMLCFLFLTFSRIYLNQREAFTVAFSTMTMFVLSQNFYLFKLVFVLTDARIKYEPSICLISLIEVCCKFIYIINIRNKVIENTIALMSNVLIMWIVENFFIYDINSYLLFLEGLVPSLMIIMTGYVLERKKKRDFFFTDELKKKWENLSSFGDSPRCLAATFKDNQLVYGNKTLLKDLGKDGEELETDPHNIKLVTSYAKIICFSKFTSVNPKLNEVFKTNLMNYTNDGINILFEFINSYQNSFEDYVYLGSKTNKDCYIKFNSVDHSIHFVEYEVNTQPLKEENDSSSIFTKVAVMCSKITHEIKNPLIAVKTIIKQIKGISMDNQTLESLDQIIDYTEYMMVIVKDVEYLAKRVNNVNDTRYVGDINLQLVNFKQTVTFCVDLIRSMAKIKNSTVQINLNYDDKLSEFIFTDGLRLKQIFINILSNSLKFTKIGFINITCQDSNDFIIVKIEDTGIGIKDEDLNALNNPFCKLNSGTINNEFGAGLGVNIVRDLIAQLGKDFRMDSVYNEGTCTSFLLNKNNESIRKDPTFIASHISKMKTRGSDKDIRMRPIGKKESITSRSKLTISIKNVELNLTERKEFSLFRPDMYVDYNSSISELIEQKSNLLHKSKTDTKDSKNLSNKANIKPWKTTSQKYSIGLNETQLNDLTDENESKKIHLLVVEDDNTLRSAQIYKIRKFAKEYNLNIAIDECKDGFECLYKVYEGYSKGIKYEMVFTDESMTFLSGNFMSFVLKSLISDRILYPMKIYLSSSNTYEPDLVYRGLKIYDDVFSKPISTVNLLSIFTELNST